MQIVLLAVIIQNPIITDKLWWEREETTFMENDST